MGKIMAIYCGLSTPKWEIADVDCESTNPPLFPAPYFVKPRYGASSKNIDEKSICDSWGAAATRIQYLHNLGEDAIVEEFVDGVFYSSPVIFRNGHPIVLPAIREESKVRGNVVTYKQKRKTELCNGASQTRLSWFSGLKNFIILFQFVIIVVLLFIIWCMHADHFVV